MTMVSRNDLLKCMAAVDAGLSPKDVVEQSSCYVLRNGRMRTFNDDVSCSVKLPDGMGEMECAVPAAEFRSLLSKMDAEEGLDVSLGGEGSEGQLLLKAKRRRAGIRVQLKVTLPVDEVKPPDKWIALPEGFAEAAETVGQVAGKSEQLFALCCVNVTPKGLEATDNYQAIRYKMDTGLKESVLVKQDDLSRIVKLGVEEWGLTEAWVHFRGPSGLSASCRRWSQSYPDLGPLFKVDGREGTLPKGLDDAVQRAEVFASAKDDAVGVSVDLNSSCLLLRGEGPVGWYEERQRTDYDGEPISFRIAPRLLREVCRRSTRCVIGKEKLRVVSDKYVYVSCLAVSEEEED